jgi:cyclopropane fatty-acyl-phospholipid synthase-like methyltransferase
MLSDLRTSLATARNRDPILAVLREHLPTTGTVLEIAAGLGEHAIHFAAAFPGLTWQPSDASEEARDIIQARYEAAGLPNLQAPLPLSAAEPETWPAADAIVCINMVHISPWSATEGLLRGARSVLPSGGVLYLYGPYREAGVETAPSNEAFDLSLKSRDPAWGLRDLQTVIDLTKDNGLDLTVRIAMPANNLSLVFTRR